MRAIERAILGVVIATGVSSVVIQLLTIREFLALFQGNEFVIALILFFWLTLGGLGTRLAQLATQEHRKVTVTRLAVLSFTLVGLSPLHLLVIRLGHPFIFMRGTSVGFYPTLGYILITIAPYTLLIGFALPYSLFALRSIIPHYPGARIYITDNLGDVIGGAFFSFVLIFWATPFQAAFWSNVPLGACTALLLWQTHRRRLASLLPLCGVLAILGIGVWVEPLTLVPAEGSLVFYRESRYGRLEVHQAQEQITLFRDGVPLYSNQNQMIAEETIHYPLSQIANPRSVLLLSYEGGVMPELQKYNLGSIDYVELDPDVTAALQRFGLLSGIEGLNRFHLDGRLFLTQTLKTYDAIIVNLPEPDTFQTNRFFTDHFFALARQHLAAEGVLSFCMSGFDNYLDEPQRQKLSSLYKTVKRHFREVILLPGQRIVFLCRNAPVDMDIPKLLAHKGIPAPYIQGYFYGDVTAERIERLNALLDPAAPVNQDLFPRLIRLMFSQWFAKFATSPTLFVILFLVMTVAYGRSLSKEEFVLFSTGFMTMGSEILVIFAFQIFFGYIYFQIGLIVTVFLAGLMPGAWFGLRLEKKGHQVLARLDLLLIALLGFFIAALIVGGSRLPVVFFLLFGFAVSLACGFQFPVALHAAGGGSAAVVRTFSADLLGAAAGTLVTSLVLIPFSGVVGAAAGLILIKLTSFLILRYHHA